MNPPLHPADIHSATTEAEPLTLEHVCRTCAVHSDFLLALLEEGVIEPIAGQTPEDWLFSPVHVQHVSVAWRLQHDLGVNPAGTAVVLQLLDEIHTLRAQLGPETAKEANTR
jgi:chaperone modulatory protein CbpM